MTTERERIDRMLAEGKVSAEEAQRLRAALDVSEREEAQAPAGAREAIAKPRLSRLALAGALGLPVAVVAFLLLAGIAILCGLPDDRAAEGGFLVAAAVVLTGLGLSIAGRVAIRRAPDELRGRTLALWGIALQGLAVLCAVGVTLILGHLARQARMRDRNRAEEAERRRIEEEARREEEREAWSHIYDLWHRFRKLACQPREPQQFPVRLELLEPGWAEDYRAGKIPETDLQDTVLDEVVLALADELSETNHDWSSRLDRHYVVFSLDKPRLLVPFRKIAGEWYLAREKVTYDFPRGSVWPKKKEKLREDIREIRDRWTRFSALAVSGDVRAEGLREFLHPRLLERIREGRVSREDLRRTILSESAVEFLKRQERDAASFWETTIRLHWTGDNGALVVTNGEAYAEASLEKIEGRWRFEGFRFLWPAVRTPAGGGGREERTR
ncbi:MAG: hypothetical protein ACYTKD_15540 [Planctomycetota bacterium]|jgi:hypothetical protein